MAPLTLSQKEIKSHAVRLMVWLWPKTETELWYQKLTCGKTLADLILRFPPLEAANSTVIDNFGMTIAMMLNGTEHIYGDPDPFTIESGKSPELQAWRLLVINSLALLPEQGYLMCDTARIALNTINLSFDADLRQDQSRRDYAASIVNYLNYQGQGDSISWFGALDVTSQRVALLERIPATLRVLQQSFDYFATRLPQTSVLASRMTRQKLHLQMLISSAPKMIPLALKDIAELLKPLQTNILSAAVPRIEKKTDTPYHLRNMNPNPFYGSRINAASITERYFHYANSASLAVDGAV
jgi:hypothetical protein